MSGRALIIVLLACRAALWSQQISYSRNFETIRKNVPLAIVNAAPHYFYVLRYNKMAHDFIVERRSKPAADILNFTPLRLDSVNASWFDYENLDYLFFEQGAEVFFVFGKVLNSRRSVFIKRVDTLGRYSAFVEITGMDRPKDAADFYYLFSRSGEGHLLIVACQVMVNHSTRKTAILYDLNAGAISWTKRLPLENGKTGYSTAFTANAQTLYYVMVQSKIAGYSRRYANRTQQMLPVFHFDTLRLVRYGEQAPESSLLAIHDFSRLNSLQLLQKDSSITVMAHFAAAGPQGGEEQVYFLNQQFSKTTGAEHYAFISPLRKELNEQLRFFDGSDSDLPSDKEYLHRQTIVSGDRAYRIAERTDAGYYKELLVWKSDLGNGLVEQQAIVPRKVFYFPGRSRFRKIGVASHVLCGGNLISIMLEHRRNAEKTAGEFSYHRFGRQYQMAYANVVAYVLRADGSVDKKVLLRNGDYDYVPLDNHSSQCDHVFYQNRGKLERFAILQLNQL